MDLPSLGYQEYAVIILTFFLLRLVRGWRRADLARAERIRSCGKVSKGYAVLALTVFGYCLGVSLLQGLGLRQLGEEVFLDLGGAAGLFLIVGMPFVMGLLVWPERRRPECSR